MEKCELFAIQTKIFKVDLVEREFLHDALNGNKPTVRFAVSVAKRAYNTSLTDVNERLETRRWNFETTSAVAYTRVAY